MDSDKEPPEELSARHMIHISFSPHVFACGGAHGNGVHMFEFDSKGRQEPFIPAIYTIHVSLLSQIVFPD